MTTIQEGAELVRNVLYDPKLGLVSGELPTNTLKSIVEVASGLSATDRAYVRDFFAASIEGATGNSLGLECHGETLHTFNLLKKKLPEGFIVQAEQNLAKNGNKYRFPLSVLKALHQDKTPYEGFEDAMIDLSDDRGEFNLCPDSESFLFSAIRMGGASIITHDNKLFMIAKLSRRTKPDSIKRTLGKLAGYCFEDRGPFTKGIIYSPDMTEEKIGSIEDEVCTSQDPKSGIYEWEDVAHHWYLDRPIWGTNPDYLDEFPPVYFKAILDHDLAAKFTDRLKDEALRYTPLGRRQPQDYDDIQ